MAHTPFVGPMRQNPPPEYIPQRTTDQGNLPHQGRGQAFSTETQQASASDGLLDYLTRRDLVVQALTTFDNQVENFRAWRLSFKNVMNTARLSPSEELNLLVKWTSGRSRGIVERARSVNILHPETGLGEAWERLEEAYGKPEVVTDSLLKLAKNFPKIGNNENQKLREYSDVLAMLNAAKEEGDLPGLAYLDTHIGVADLVQKLPYGLQEKWRSRGKDYKDKHNVAFPPFDFFNSFVRKMAEERNDPSFDFRGSQLEGRASGRYRSERSNAGITVNVTEVGSDSVQCDPGKECPIHKLPHALSKCLEFRQKPWDEKMELLRSLGICFKCCATTKHIARNCKVQVKCSECNSNKHLFALHFSRGQGTSDRHGGERHRAPETSSHGASVANVSSTCTEVCGEGFHGKSCAKICLVRVYPSGHPENSVKVYALLDDQSNRSLAKTEFFDSLGLKGDRVPYSLKTCSGSSQASGRRAKDLTVESLDGKTVLSLPTLIECNEIPNNRTEIPTPEAGKYFPHLKPIISHIPALDEEAQISLLLGRDILQVHKVREQRNGPGNAPFAQRLDLGWVIVGDTCLNGTHKRENISSYKTCVHPSGRTSLFLEPCPNRIRIKDRDPDVVYEASHPVSKTNGNVVDVHKTSITQKEMTPPIKYQDGIGENVFERTKADNKLGLSIEDKKFLEIMNEEMSQNNVAK